MKVQDTGYLPEGEQTLYGTPGEYHRGRPTQKKIAKSKPLDNPVQKGDGTIEGSHFRSRDTGIAAGKV